MYSSNALTNLGIFLFVIQGGYSSNAPTKLVKNIFSSLDRSLQRVMGAPASPQPIPSLPPMPPTSGVSMGAVAGASQRDMTSQAVPKFVNSQSAMTMSALMPSASVESISQWANDGNISSKKSMHNRSVSEPDFARSPKQVSIPPLSPVSLTFPPSISCNLSLKFT
jgi:COPII coat assembly protein SEC16